MSVNGNLVRHLVQTLTVHDVKLVLVQRTTADHVTDAPFSQIDIIGAMVIVWRVRGKIIRSVLCSIVCNNCAQ